VCHDPALIATSHVVPKRACGDFSAMSFSEVRSEFESFIIAYRKSIVCQLISLSFWHSSAMAVLTRI
jgi:hypothetical protein